MATVVSVVSKPVLLFFYSRRIPYIGKIDEQYFYSIKFCCLVSKVANRWGFSPHGILTMRAVFHTVRLDSFMEAVVCMFLQST